MDKPKKSFLMRQDPYHTPGYAGYVPQLKYRIGSTYGCHTHDLLTDAGVRKSARTVLTQTWPPPKLDQSAVAPSTYNTFTNDRSWGDKKYTWEMIPGYTGFVPKGQNYFSNRYSESCRHAIASFENDQFTHQSKMRELSTIAQQQADNTERMNFTTAQNTTPLRPIAKKADPFLPVYAKQHTASPLNLPHGHPNKFFMSGYMGFVPRSEKYFGQGYPINTQRALQEFGADGHRLRDTLEQPFSLEQPMTSPEVSGKGTIYLRDSGLIPRYTGHIPGQKYKFAATFGSSTRDALPQVAN